MKQKWKKAVSLALSAAMATGMLAGMIPVEASAAPAEEGEIQAEFFVSPEGNDKNDGSYGHPFATLEAARDAVREINDDMTGDIYVFIDGGNYYVDETVVFDEQDSGTNGHKIVYRNLDEVASASFIGGKQVDSDWKLVENEGADADLPDSAVGKVYKTNVGTDYIFDTIYVNDERATLARTQNKAQIAGFESALTPYMKSAGGGISNLEYHEGDLSEEAIAGLVNAQERGDLDASVYMWDGGYWDWMTDTIPLSAIDAGACNLTFKTVEGHPEIYRPKYNTGMNARYFLQGNLGFLDAPGEYYYNKTTGGLYYYPEEGAIEEQEIIIPQVKEIIRVEGSSRENMVENIEFSGLEFKDTNTTDWYAYGWNWGDANAGLGFYPEEAEGSTQPSYCEQTERIEFQYGNITLKNTRNITISKSHITNSGMFGIDVYLANQNTVIEDCLINYTGHGGINIDGGYPGVGGDENGDGYSRDNIVRNTVIHNVGELIGQATGLTVQQSGYNTFSNLEVYNSPRRGVFITAGNSRNPNQAYPDGDADYDAMTDMYSHHNKFEYIYIHDCQQDGGDDGAFFGCYLYKGNENYKPNYMNQVIIDSTGANPTMADYGPNCINLDMGCSGFELSNVKAVNPMNFNIEVNTIKQYGDVIKFDNVNIDYGTMVNEIDEFDDSKMEYDKIGVTAGYPAEYMDSVTKDFVETPEDLYFSEDFEAGLNYTKWAAAGTNPEITTQWFSEDPLSGKQGIELSGNSRLYREFGENLNKVVTVMMFDRQNNNLAAYDSGIQNSSKVTSIARADDGENIIGIGLDSNNMNNYVVQIGDEKEATEVQRTFGWHELKFDYTSGTDVKLYIDGTLVKTVDADGFDYVSLGSDDGYGIAYYDQLYIYGGAEAEDPGNVTIPAPPAYDASNDNKEQLYLDLEDGELPGFKPTNDKSQMEVVADPDNAENKVLYIDIQDGHNFYQTGNKEWTNYVMNLKWKFAGWGEQNVLDKQYDNFTIFVMTNLEGDSKEENPGSYQIVYRRNLYGGNGFEAEVPYFEICKHSSGGDAHLGYAAAPEGFDESAWHELQIQTFDGKVGFVIDGTTLLTANDGSYTYGGIGFGGINAQVYMDDIQVISNPTYVEYPDNFGLTNAKVNGSFNPDYYMYSAVIEDKEKPVVMELPKPILEGASVKVALNGEDITEKFAETGKVELELKNASNTLVISEVTSAGSRDYTIYIDNSGKVTEVAPIDLISTGAGKAPELPAEVKVKFDDGTESSAAIVWNMINPWSYKQPGEFTVKGVLKDYNETVTVKVTADGLQSIGKLADIKTEAGKAPALPKTVSAQFLSGAKDLPLTFKPADDSLYEKAGTVVLVAEAEGYNGTLLQNVTVTGEGTEPEDPDKPGNPDEPENPDEPGGSDKPDDSDKPGDIPDKDDGNGSGADGENGQSDSAGQKQVQTGDDTSVAVPVAVMVVAAVLAGGTIFIRRKKLHK